MFPVHAIRRLNLDGVSYSYLGARTLGRRGYNVEFTDRSEALLMRLAIAEAVLAVLNQGARFAAEYYSLERIEE